jgi:hypothetical protein
MDELDKIFLEQKDEFMDEPPSGHINRFKERISELDNPKVSKSNFTIFWRVAAVAIIALLITNVFIHIAPEQDVPVSKSPSFPIEISNAGFYYTNQINSGISELKNLSAKGLLATKEIELLNDELSEMDSLFIILKKEFNSNPNDERIMKAMVEHYQTKLEIINTILNDLKKVKQQKNINHETNI